jgi:hypothetical protein
MTNKLTLSQKKAVNNIVTAFYYKGLKVLQLSITSSQRGE